MHVHRPRILLTNDDGIDAPGLAALVAAFEHLGEVWVVAPAAEQSGVSSALSLHSPVRVRRHQERHFSVSGTPADCVYMALCSILPQPPDLCVSGINHGANIGDDVLYSGTVAAAIEATTCDVPALAVSHAAWGKEHDFSHAAVFAIRVAKQILMHGLPRGVLLNLNVPKVCDTDSEIRICKLGKRNYERHVVEKKDPRGSPYYWIGGSSISADDIPGTDCNALAKDLASLTPISIDMTNYRFLNQLKSWSIL